MLAGSWLKWYFATSALFTGKGGTPILPGYGLGANPGTTATLLLGVPSSEAPGL
jgi:hypothetical protein